ncbi:FMN-binding protein, partial [Chloroflexota bacterium]
QGDLFIGYNADNGEIVGYAAAGVAPGYGGPVELLVGMDTAGTVAGVKLIKHRETPGFFRLILGADIFAQFIDLPYDAAFTLGEDIDAVSGATVSAEGIAAAARSSIRRIAKDGLAQTLPPENRSIKFGIPEILLILLFITGYIGHKTRAGVWKRRVRWGTLLTGMIVLGFVYTAPLTITIVTSLISGYWPDWHNNIYWYILLGGVLFVTMIDGQNPYCGWFCPFGTVQECLGTLSGVKRLYRPKGWHYPLRWLQRGLALVAILLGVLLRRPGVSGYEPFATMFTLQGIGIEWALLIIVLLASLMTYRPFCNLLCPIDGVISYITTARKWIREIWNNKWKKQDAKA